MMHVNESGGAGPWVLLLHPRGSVIRVFVLWVADRLVVPADREDHPTDEFPQTFEAVEQQKQPIRGCRHAKKARRGQQRSRVGGA